MSKLTPEKLGLEISTEGFRKAQTDIIQTTKTIADYQDRLKRLRYEQEKLKSAHKEGTKAYREKTVEITKIKKEINALTDILKKQESSLGLTGMSYNQLKKRAGELTKELYNLSRAANPEKWKEVSSELKKYQDQMTKMQQGIKMTNASFKNQKPTVWTNLKQLIPIASVTAIGAKLTSVANQAIQTFTRLDDKMADVQKTTQMSKAEVKALDAELMKIDTRTSREDLLDLARVAGKLGVAKNEVAGFVRAADQIRVALTEDLGGNVEESIRKIGKLADIFKIKDQLGLEKSLLSIGSAINSLGAASTANEENIVDFTNRTAGIAPQAKVSIQNVMGLGAAIDILGQSAEVGGTTYSQVMTGMFKKTDEYAKVAGMSVKEFTDLLNRDANEAFIKFLEGANSGGDMSGMTKKLAELKLEGTRSTQVLGALAGNVDLLRNQQALSNAEFAKATSLQEEANTKNASAQALIEKRLKVINQIVASLGEELMPLWSETLGLTAGFMSILKAVIGTLIEYKGVILAVATVASAYIAVKKLQIFYSKAHLVQIDAEAKGIIASNGATIAATLGAKALAAAKMLVTFQFRAAAVAANSFFLALGPIGWAVTAISALIPLIKGVKSSIDAVKEANRKLSKEQATLNSELEVESSKINILFSRLNHAKKGTDEYVKAKKAILDQYGSYLDGMSKEIRSLDNVKGAYEAITRAARASVIERLRANQVEDAAQEAGESWEEALTNMDQNLQAAFKKGKEGLAKTLFPAIRDALNAENTTVLSDLEAGRLRVLKVLQDTYGKQGASKIYNRITGDIENYLRATDKFKTRQEEISRIYGADTLPLSSGNSSTAETEENGGGGDDKKQKGKWSLSSDEAYLKAKAELRERQMAGDIATEEEYSRQLLALEIKTLEDRIALNKEKDADLVKLKSELAEKEYQQRKTEKSRLQKLLDATLEGATAAERENAAYEKRLKDLELFGKRREEMTKEEQRAFDTQERLHLAKLSALYVDELSKEISNQQNAIQRKATALKQSHNDELAKATTFEQKKQLLGKWFSAEELRRIKTDKQADEALKKQYAADEKAALKEDLELQLALWQGIVDEVGRTGLLENGVAATEEDKAKLLAIIDELQKKLAELGVTPMPTLGGDKDRKSNVDILGMSVEDWERFHANVEAGKFGLDEIVAVANAIASAFSSVNELVSAMEQREFKNYEKTQKKKKAVLDRQLKSGTISQERYNESVQRIDEETDAKREEMERKQAKRQKMLSVFQSLVNTAVAVSAMLGAQPAGPWNIPLAITVGAMGLVQTAAILATPLPGAEEGGLIGVEREQDGKRFNAEFAPRKRGYIRRPTVIRTDGGQPVITGEAGVEYVVPNHLLQVPQIASMVGLIEAARLNGTFRPVNLSAAQAASGTIPGRAGGGYVGDNPLAAAMIAGGQASASAVSDDGVFRELKEVVGKLNKKLDEPIPTYVTINGPNGIETIKNKLKQQQRRAGIGGK